jgi:NAD(P)-dependent dehydrogenase (short-subunit alcohol dehydrogenase family)
MSPKRVLLLGAETGLGRATASDVAATGARLALVSSTTDADAAFGVQRLARKLGATNQAIDATNEAAVRVMVRQVAKELGGLDATIVCVSDPAARLLAERFAGKEMEKSGAGTFIDATTIKDVVQAVEGLSP